MSDQDRPENSVRTPCIKVCIVDGESGLCMGCYRRLNEVAGWSKMTPEARARSAAKAQALLADMPLDELRQARGLSQKMLADILHVQQPAIAKLEKRTDIYISTLRSHIEAMGGQLDVIARFPDGAVRITTFSDLAGPGKV